MEITILPIGPLECECCGLISFHEIVFKTRWYVPVLLDRLLTKSNLRCTCCEKQYKMTAEGSKQAKLYEQNFGKDRHGVPSFEQLLLNVIEQNQIVVDGCINYENLDKAVNFMSKTYGSSQGFDGNFYRRYILILCQRYNF